MSYRSETGVAAAPRLPTTGPTYLPGLNGIRAIAATIVVLWHSDQFARFFGLTPNGFSSSGMAGSAVTMFFVLSGYLITLLLIKEKQRFGTIDVARFYGRRILRIWPVYYLTILLGVLMTTAGMGNDDADSARVFLYVIFLPNLAYASGIAIFLITPLWSVGVEEQFYLLWPWVVRRSQNLPRSLAQIILLYAALKTAARFLENGPIYSFLTMTSIDAMAIGGMYAWMLTSNTGLEIAFSRKLQVLCWATLLGGIIYKPLTITNLIDPEIHALIYGILILNVSANPRTLISLENPVCNFVGRMSYGLYAYHVLVICSIGPAMAPSIAKMEPSWLRALVAIGTCYFTTLFLAYLSHHLWERRFLFWKQRLAKISSTDKAL